MESFNLTTSSTFELVSGLRQFCYQTHVWSERIPSENIFSLALAILFALRTAARMQRGEEGRKVGKTVGRRRGELELGLLFLLHSISLGVPQLKTIRLNEVIHLARPAFLPSLPPSLPSTLPTATEATGTATASEKQRLRPYHRGDVSLAPLATECRDAILHSTNLSAAALPLTQTRCFR